VGDVAGPACLRAAFGQGKHGGRGQHGLNDNTVRLGGQVIDIAPGPRHRSYAGKPVEVNQLLDGSWRVYWQDQQIATAPATTFGELRTLKRRKPKGRATPRL
jgi:hypothetical protein